MGADVFMSSATGFTVQYVNGTTGWTNPWYGYPASASSGTTYTLTPSAGTGGTIAPNTPQTVVQGGSISFVITPTTGYRIADVSVDGASQGNVSSYAFTNVTSNHTIKAVFEKEQEQTVMVLQVGNAAFTVNGVAKTLDSPPVIKNGRTLVPIRAIIEALGGTVGWDATARKATVTLGSATVELWIGKSAAKVNGVSTLIDPANAKVVPEIINGRTMLPVRFVSENLGCSVRLGRRNQDDNDHVRAVGDRLPIRKNGGCTSSCSPISCLQGLTPDKSVTLPKRTSTPPTRSCRP